MVVVSAVHIVHRCSHGLNTHHAPHSAADSFIFSTKTMVVTQMKDTKYTNRFEGVIERN